MIKVQVNQKQVDKKNDIEEIEKLMAEVTDFDIYYTIKRWEALYPHTYGDELLKELLSKDK
jgi:hypothetical protein